MSFLNIDFRTLLAVVNSEACFFGVNGSSGLISSSGTKNYERCTWIITAPSNHTVKLIFTTFRLSDYYWNKAEIQVYDGKRTNDTVLGVFAGTRQPFMIQTSGRFMMLSLKKKYLFSPGIFEGTYYTTKGKL